ncbi:MAG TPA: acetate/propionate family kinase [Acidimicrobiia bacterium]|nr:acetate/propionate family kinase [Acidimicrobiia bacterium]
MVRVPVNLLVVNAGSSSLKLSVLDDGDRVVSRRDLGDWDGDADVVADFAREVGAVDAVAHRVVHGGERYTGAVTVDDEVVRELGRLVSLAPLHQPRAIAGIEAARRALPDVTHVACFDTAFHATLAPEAYVYALPARWRRKWPLRRFGFHGLSHAYAFRRVAQLAAVDPDDLQVVSCHLGAGASLCAVRGGRSVDTTMGFTPLEGLVMATRAGSIDPGLVLWLQQTGGLTAREVADGLERDSGLNGIAGTGDMREILERRARGDADATLAFDVYAHRLRREIGAMAAALDRVDACVFTGGVGEHAPEVRAACGMQIDTDANAATTSDGEISAAGGRTRTFVVTAGEDLEMANQVRSRKV